MDEVPFVMDEHERIHTNEAIIVIITDFGVEGMTYGMSKQEVEKLVEQESMQLWQNPTQVHFIQYIVPFLPFDQGHFVEVVRHQLEEVIHHPVLEKKRVRKIVWDLAVPKYLAEIVSNNYPTRFGRGVGLVVNGVITGPLVSLITEIDKDQAQLEQPYVYLSAGPNNEISVEYCGTRNHTRICHKKREDKDILPLLK